MNEAASCTCIRDYTGNPYIECKPECVVNAECPRHLACVNQHCVDPCPGVCGYHATCFVANHVPQCGCDPSYTGDAFTACHRLTTSPAPTEVIDPCPGVCGYHATCFVANHVPQCGCDPSYTGDAFTACHRLTTSPAPTEVIDPCNPSPCGENANARTEIGQEHVNVSLNTWGILM